MTCPHCGGIKDQFTAWCPHCESCDICGRGLKDHRTCAEDDPAMDCGGTCLACMEKAEISEELLPAMLEPWPKS